MRTTRVAALAAALCGALPPPSSAEPDPITPEAALARAAQSSPALRAARGRVSEAEARLRTRPRLAENPEVEAARGARRSTDASDFEVGLSLTVPLGGRGGARRAIDEAGLAQARAEADEVERTVRREVRETFVAGLHAEERLRLARSVEADADELRRIADRRHAAGDVAALEVNVAESAWARAQADAKAAEAAAVEARGTLRVLLDAETSLAPTGRLDLNEPFEPSARLAKVDDRPTIRSLEAQVREAESEARLGRMFAWPEVTPGVRYDRDAG